MRYLTSLLVFLTLIAPLASAADDDNHGKALVEQVVKAVGGVERLYALSDVEYTYTYRDAATGAADVSLERYLFDGERSWAIYKKRENTLMPETSGILVQGFDGESAWVTVDGKALKEEAAVKRADFLRKTNYYWFAMMHKLLDEGIQYDYEGTRKVEDTTYDVVRITFDPGVGDVSDTYVLYINPRTKLVDQFLFTVMDFGVKEPYLMKVEYEEVAGLKLPAKRKYAAASWDGSLRPEATWVEEIMTDISFQNGFSTEDFDNPVTG